jgi:hypothetical protein
MSDNRVDHERDADGQSLERVIAELRAPVPVRTEWRVGVLRGIATMPRPTARAAAGVTRWRIRPVTAIAAGLVCALVGAGVTALALDRGRHLTPNDELGTLAARMPVPGEVATRPTVRFVFVAPYASRVALVGDFNKWNPSAAPMRRSADGKAWLIDVPLAPGRHVYSFVVDGDLTPDPAAPRAGDDDFGVPSSVVLVGGRGGRT